jgi:DNA-directed RNA polymerase subunit RPC12/RpoP
MGTSYIFKCNKCDYEVRSSGKLDRGKMAVVKPYICSVCKEVFDVLVGKHGQVILEESLNDEQKEEFYKCPECNGRQLTEWNPRYHKCPKCTGRMLKDDIDIELWD